MFKAYLYAVLAEISAYINLLVVIFSLLSLLLNLVYLAYILDYGFSKISDSMKLAYKRVMITTIVIMIIDLLIPSKEILELLLLKQ